MSTPHSTKITAALLILLLLGIVLSGYLLVLHYLPGPSFCAVGTIVNCDTVNKGPYGDVAGIPVALIGLFGYLCAAIVVARQLLYPSTRTLWMIRGLCTLGFLFSLWLLYLELFVIFAICPFCMASLILITISTSLAWTIPPPMEQVEPLDQKT